jgi:hypothetical protein
LGSCCAEAEAAAKANSRAPIFGQYATAFADANWQLNELLFLIRGIMGTSLF